MSSNGNGFHGTDPFEGYPPVTGGINSQRASNACFDTFFVVYLNKRLNKQSSHRLFETSECPLWRHCNGESYRAFVITCYALLQPFFYISDRVGIRIKAQILLAPKNKKRSRGLFFFNALRLRKNKPHFADICQWVFLIGNRYFKYHQSLFSGF